MGIGEFDLAVAFKGEEKVVIFIHEIHQRVVVLAVYSKVILFHKKVDDAIRWQHS